MKDYFRPLRITHEYFGYSPDMSVEEKTKHIESRIKDLKQKGFGGLVTNVHNANYLHDDEEWRLMREKVRICRENDMRMWLYDEKGYPSGGAGTETLSANPDYEARALVLVAKVLSPGDKWIAELPKGHEKTVSAFAYSIKGTQISEEELLCNPLRFAPENKISFSNDLKCNLLCMVFYVKHMYEGGHCRHNVCAARRYIDVGNRDAVKEFINNTYKRYAENLEGCFAAYLGDMSENAVVEAIFTDEPSYMGVYINAGLNPPVIDHPYDDTIPLYPVVSWGRDVLNRFASVYGYRLEDELPALFFGHSEKFRNVRRDYYQLMSDLYEQSFFAQISDYCASVGLMFSGHILLEDELKLHVKFEGNFFKLLRHMHIPGIDMLHSVPEIVWQNAFTPRLVSSVSELYGRGHVMDEVSAHAQGGNVTLNQMYTSLLLQYALGADVFTSYYSDDMPVSEQCAVWDAISFAESNTIGRINGSVLLHYPIETMMYLNKPEHEFIESGDDSAALIDTCSKSMEHAMYLLLNRQIPFLFCDTDTLKIAETKKPELFIIGAGIIEPMLAANAKRLYDGGCRIVYFCETEAFSDEYVKISEFATLASSTEALLEIISENGLPTDGDTDGIAALWTDDTSLLVNSESREKKLSVNLSAAEIIDVFTKEPLEFVLKENRTCFTLPPYAAVLIKRRSNP